MAVHRAKAEECECRICGGTLSPCTDCPGPCGVYFCSNPTCTTPTTDVDVSTWAVPPVTDESTIAHLDRAIDLLAQLLPLVDPHSFQWPAAQETIRAAMALLVEHGRVGVDEMRDKATK